MKTAKTTLTEKETHSLFNLDTRHNVTGETAQLTAGRQPVLSGASKHLGPKVEKSLDLYQLLGTCLL